MFLKGRQKKKAQSTLEYAILVTVVMAAVFFMREYLKRGYHGYEKKQTDQLGQQFASGMKASTTLNSYTETVENSYPQQNVDPKGNVTFKQVSGAASFSQSNQIHDEWKEGNAEYWPYPLARDAVGGKSGQ